MRALSNVAPRRASCGARDSGLSWSHAKSAAPASTNLPRPAGTGAAGVDGAFVRRLRASVRHDGCRCGEAGDEDGQGRLFALQWHGDGAWLTRFASRAFAPRGRWPWMLREWPLLLRIALQRHRRRALSERGAATCARSCADPIACRAGAGAFRTAAATTHLLIPDRGADCRSSVLACELTIRSGHAP